MVVAEIALKSGFAPILRALKSRFHCISKYDIYLSKPICTSWVTIRHWLFYVTCTYLDM